MKSEKLKSFRIYRYFDGECFDSLKSNYFRELVDDEVFKKVENGEEYKSKYFIYTRNLKNIKKGD